ncbi:MAG: SgcJ/EcaC family oxidoreductase [Verrucomicrobiota bacterium]
MKVLARVLVLLLVVGLFYMLFVPKVGSTGRLVPRAVVKADMKSLAIAYNTYVIDAPRVRLPTSSSRHELAVTFAKEAWLNESSLYFFGDDAEEFREQPLVLDGNYVMDPEVFEKKVIFDFAVPSSKDVHSSKIPILWVSGLQEDGTWSEDSLFDGEGGLVAFMDGRVQWFERADFAKYGTDETTQNYLEALPPGSRILGSSVTVVPEELPEISDSSPEEIRQVLQAYVDGRQARDLEAVEAVLHPEVDQLTSRGEWRRGVEGATAGMKRSTSTNPGDRILTVESVRFLRPDVALADARYTIKGIDGPDRWLWSSFTLVKGEDGQWLITSIRNQKPAE